MSDIGISKSAPTIDISVENTNSGNGKEFHPSDLTNQKEEKFINRKKKPVYTLDDNVIKVIRADNDVHFKLLSNNKGVFIDIRRYNRGFPTQKGVRVYASVFKKVANLLDKDITDIVPSDDLNLNKADKIISI